jgi:signal transduction histidine kinase
VGRLPNRLSVRARTTALASAVVALALVVGASGLVLTLERSLTRSGDDLSRTRAADLAALASAGELPSRLTNVGDDSVAQVVDVSGRVLAASANLGDAGPISRTTPSAGDLVVETLRDVPDDNETESYRVWARQAETPGGTATVYVGTSLESVTEAVGALRQALWLGVPGLLALLATSTWLLIGRALRPVDGIRAEVSHISHRALDRRVPVPATNDEIARLAMTMNEMLDRLESASRRQADFVANASHELRSPLAALRTQLEVSLAHPDRTYWPALTEDLLTDTDRMERLVHDLLFLARDDDLGPRSPSPEVDLDEVVLEEAVRLKPSARVRIDTSAVSAAPVRAPRDDVARLVRNLLENAVRHARSLVRVELTATTEGVRLAVVDDGPGVPSHQRDRIFERFYRADDSRARSSGGTGLGLSIARAIAERAGGTLSLDPSESGARFVARFPRPV